MSRRTSFTLVELLVVVAIVSVLVALIFPSLSRGIDTANKTRCAGNLRSLYAGLMAYAGDNNNTLPTSQTFAAPDTGRYAWWQYLYSDYCGQDAFRCPIDKTGYNGVPVPSWTLGGRKLLNGKVSYGGMGDPTVGLQVWGKRLASFSRPAASVLLSEHQTKDKQLHQTYFFQYPRWVNEVTPVHGGGTVANVLFLDGHITSMTTNAMNAAVKAGQMVISFP